MSPTREPVARSPNHIYFPALDGLRAIAVTLVFLQHYVIPQIPTASFSWGWVGVDIFFVLSGFLITGILYDSRDLPHRLRNFYVRRSLRIFPLYYGVFLVLLLSTPLLHWNWSALWTLWPIYLGNFARFLSFATAGHMGTDALHATNTDLYIYLGHFWSLCVEEQFYLLWPLIVFTVRKRRRLLQLCAAVILLSPLVRALAFESLPPYLWNAEFVYRLLPFRADALLIGGALALLYRGPAWPRLERRLPLLLLAAVCTFLAVRSVAIFVLGESSSPSVTTPWIGVLGFSLIDVSAACLIALCLTPGRRVTRALSARPLVALGRISYGFYVFHDIPHSAYAGLLVSLRPSLTHVPLWTAALAYPATIVLAMLSFRFFELPILRFKDRFTLKSTVLAPHP